MSEEKYNLNPPYIPDDSISQEAPSEENVVSTVEDESQPSIIISEEIEPEENTFFSETEDTSDFAETDYHQLNLFDDFDMNSQESSNENQQERASEDESLYGFKLNKPKNTPHEEDDKKTIIIKKGVGPFGVIGISALAACCGLFGGVFATKIYEKSPVYTQPMINYAISPTTISGTNVKTLNDVSEIVADTMPSIVSIVSMKEYEYGYGPNETFTSPASGSGVIYSETDSDLFIVTNYHVVQDTSGLTIGWFDGTTSEGVVQGYSAQDDLALVKVSKDEIPESTIKNLKIAVLGNSDECEVGQGTIAIGNALGYGQTVTDGIVSALNREVFFDDGSSMFMMQTSAAINPGNSGGALLNARGELIGINAAKYTDTTVEGIGYAIPVNHVVSTVEDIVSGKIETEEKQPSVQLGIKGYDVTSQMSELYDMPAGICIQSVIPDSPAEAAGLTPGDIITKINNIPLQSIQQLKSILQGLSSGDEIEISIKRPDGEDYIELSLDVTL